jgi:hypothetical protein
MVASPTLLGGSACLGHTRRCAKPALTATYRTTGPKRSRARCRPPRRLGQIFGIISTRREFEEHRLELAKHEGARLAANDTLECRNCHSTPAMDFTRQSPRAERIHSKFPMTGERPCIDCYNGIAHELPDMTGITPGWTVPDELQDTAGYN